MPSNLSQKKEYDQFDDYVFAANSWSAPNYSEPAKIKGLFDSFHLVGRRIKKMRMIGLNYLLGRDDIENHVYNKLRGLPEEDRQTRSNYDNISPDVAFPRSAQIDEPLMIMFEDKDVFEIITPQEPIFRMSMNRIPWGIEAGTNLPNVYTNTLFSPCLGKKITDVEVHTYTTKKHPMYRNPFDEEPYEREFVSNVVLRFDDGTGLSIGGWIDFTLVQHIGQDNTETSITWEQLQPALFNWEDLHNDPITRYEATSPSIFFGRKGADHTETPFMSLSSSNSDSALHIAVDDFDLLDWCFAKESNAIFDEYGDYHFSYQQWHNILSEAEKILNIPTFDELFDYLVSWGIPNYIGNNHMLNLMNYRGAAYWKKRDFFRMQLRDLTNWSSLVLGTNDTMNIYGF